MMKFTYTLCFITITSCAVKKQLTFEPSKIEKIEVYQGYPGREIKMEDGFEKEFISDLNESKEVRPTKYMKTHRFLIYNKNGKIDTILTNGTIHQYKGWYRSNENLIEKYIGQNILLSDTIQCQLKVAEKLKSYMNDKNYEEAISLFSLKQQENIREIQNDNEMFQYWCLAWTFDEAKYERYISRIKSGNGDFVLENGECKINEK